MNNRASLEFNVLQQGIFCKIYATDKPIWDRPEITLTGSILSTPIVEGVTKYKVYDNGSYIGYIDSDNVWHEKDGE